MNLLGWIVIKIGGPELSGIRVENLDQTESGGGGDTSNK